MGWTSTRRAVAASGVVAVLLASGVGPALATAGLAATATTTTAVAQGTTTRLTGLAVTGAADGDTLAVTVATSRGTVRIDTSTGVVLAYGNTASGASVSFTGSPAQVGAALAATDLTVPGGTSGLSATVTLTAYQQQAGIVYGAATGHFYEFVSGALSWDAARAAATSRTFLGKTGYLVTITSSAENSIVTSRIPNAQSVWIGAHAVTGSSPRDWQWADGPEAGQVFVTCSNAAGSCDFATRPGYANWSSGEPNNWGGTTGVDGEWVAVTNWNSYNGLWNDLSATSSTSGYVVEYGDGTAFSQVATASADVSILAVPGAPTGVSASPGSEQATVTFAAPASDGGSAVTGYTVTASPGGATASCAASPCTVTGLTALQAYTFTVTATSAVGTSSPSGASASVTVWPQPSPPTAPTGMSTTPMLGVAYTNAVTSAGFPAPTYAVTDGALPTGLALDPSTGAVTGTPTTVGTWSVQVTATNSQGSDHATLSGYVGAVPTAITGSIGDLPVGTAVTIALDADGYPAPGWTVTGGALPDGLTLSLADGVVTGTPTTAGPYSVTLTVTNAHGSASRTLTGAVLAPPSSIGGTVPQLMVGVAASVTLTADGNPASTFTVTDGALPAGVSLAPTTGVLAGTPLVVGTWTATVTATNSQGSTTRLIGGHVGAVPSAISGALPALAWSTPVAVVLSSSGYPAPTFAVTAGALPAGLSLDATTGAVTGVPTTVGAYEVTITASNEHGTADVTFTGSVAPVLPGAPAGLVTRPGDELAYLTFEAPTSDGGSAVTGYEVSIDGGAWQSFATSAGSTVSGTVTGLVDGVEVQLRVRAVTVAGHGPASASAAVYPVAPPPSPVPAPTAVAGVSSVTVTWRASTERDVTGYTVVASPGPATCTTAADETSCVLGATAGEPVTFTVVTHSRWGDSAASDASDAVVAESPAVPSAPPAAAPTTLTTSEGDISSVRTGQRVTVLGTGFAPYSSVAVVIYSAPRVLATVLTDASGSFTVEVTVPADLEVGQHTFVAYGVEPSGAEHAMRLPVELPAVAPRLATTGVDPGPLTLLAVVLLGSGVVLRLAARRFAPARVSAGPGRAEASACAGRRAGRH